MTFPLKVEMMYDLIVCSSYDYIYYVYAEV